MRRAFKYRLWTNANQERELGIMLETHRRLYNACLEQRKTAYETEKRSITYFQQCKEFIQQKKVNFYYSRLNCHSAQATIRRLDKSFQNFFRCVKKKVGKPGYPRFKAINRYDSITYPFHGNGIKLIGNKLRVQHVGFIRVKLHRPVEGKIKTLTLKKEAGKWYVIASCVLPDVPLVEDIKPSIGIDVGLTHFLTDSNGRREANPRYLKEALPKLRRASRSVSRKKLGGGNRRKAVKRLQKIHTRVKNLRKEHHYQVACKLVHSSSFIAVESLNIKGMVRNHRMSRSISDVSWASFITILQHKAEKAGVRFVAVDPKNTSQGCSSCHKIVKKDLSVRWHSCPYCGLSLDRDHNAALNILARARLAWTEPVGLTSATRVLSQEAAAVK